MALESRDGKRVVLGAVPTVELVRRHAELSLKAPQNYREGLRRIDQTLHHVPLTLPESCLMPTVSLRFLPERR